MLCSIMFYFTVQLPFNYCALLGIFFLICSQVTLVTDLQTHEAGQDYRESGQ